MGLAGARGGWRVLGLLERVRARFGGPVLAAGGVGSIADLESIEQVGCEGAVVGRALLDGRLPLDVLSPAAEARP